MSTVSTATSPTPDDDAVQRAKREIQGIVQQISELARQDVAADRFYDEFLNKVVSALAAAGGAVWTLSDTKQLQLNYQINLRETGLIDNPIGQEQHGRLLSKALGEDEGLLIAPHSGSTGGSDQDDEHAAANPTDFLLVMAPMLNDQGVQGVVEVFQRPGARPATQRGYLRFLLQTCELAGDYLRGQRLRHLADKQSLWEQLESFTRNAHQKLDVRESAYTIANEGRRLIGCDRVTVAIQRGGRMVLEAISGQDTFDKRSNVARLLTKVAKSVAKTAEDVWYTGDTSKMAPQVEKALDAYVDESHTKTMAILPLVVHDDEEPSLDDKAPRRRKPPQVLGALIVEQMVDSQEPEGFRQRVDVVRTHSVTSIGNSLEHEGLFLMPLWKMLGKATWLFRGRTLPKTIGATLLIGGLIAWALVGKTDFKLQGDGKLKPATISSVFAHVAGEVDEVLVEQRSAVIAGQELVRQRSIDLDKEIEAIVGEINEAQAEQTTLRNSVLGLENLRPTEREQQLARLSQIESKLGSLQKQLQLLEVKRNQLVITAPIDGVVITSQVKKNLLGRPLRPGVVVMEIADPSQDWEVELLMPEKRMAHIRRTQAELEEGESIRVVFIPRSQPESQLEGRIVEIDPTAEARGEEGNTVRMRVAFDQAEFKKVIDNPVVGAEVIANVYCGKESWAYSYFHDLVDAIRTHVLFRFKP